jgi:hypothetical protein
VNPVPRSVENLFRPNPVRISYHKHQILTMCSHEQSSSSAVFLGLHGLEAYSGLLFPCKADKKKTEAFDIISFDPLFESGNIP